MMGSLFNAFYAIFSTVLPSLSFAVKSAPAASNFLTTFGHLSNSASIKAVVSSSSAELARFLSQSSNFNIHNQVTSI